jgi:hypothetical protein
MPKISEKVRRLLAFLTSESAPAPGDGRWNRRECPVTCRVKLKDCAEPIVLKAWALVGSPKYAPELRNISTLSDVMFDVAVRYKNLIPQLYANGSFNPLYAAHEYPYFVEKERNHDKFVASAVAVGHPINQLAASGSYLTPTNYFTPAWNLKDEGEIAECDGTPDCKHPQ